MRMRSIGLLTATLLTAVAGCTGTATKSGSGPTETDPAKVSGEITVLTQRTDLVNDGTMDKYAAEFNKAYPKVRVKFQGITDYENEVKTRMNTTSYGDVLMIPSVVKLTDYPHFFDSLGNQKDMSAKYRYIPNFSVSDKTYGLAINGNLNGAVYNKAVWQQAGITTWPTTTDEFFTDLQAIKSKTSAIPYYTNYHDGWPTTQFFNVLGSISCDVAANDKLATTSAPWASGAELNTIYSMQYTLAKQKLIEPDPTTTNWENSKGMIATGKVATMWLGSWAVSQMQAAAKKAGADPANIGFMPFPAQVDGKFCAVSAPDYAQAVSIHSKAKNAAHAWVTWFVDKSNYAQNEGSVPTVKDASWPATVKPYQDAGVKFIELNQDKAALVKTIDNTSEVGLTKPDYYQKLIDAGRGAASGSADTIFAEMNKKWGEAVKKAGS